MTPQEFTNALNKLGWSDVTAAETLGVSRQMIWNYKNGKTKLKKLAVSYLKDKLNKQW